MNSARRSFIQSFAALGAGALASAKAFAMGQQGNAMPCTPGMAMPGCPESADDGTAAVVTPDVPNLPFEMDNGVKVFHLIAEPVKQNNFSRQGREPLGLQRHCARPHDSGEPGRSRAHHRR